MWGGRGISSCIDLQLHKLCALQHQSSRGFLSRPCGVFANGCRGQTSADLVSHSASPLACFGVTGCFYVEWLMLAPKGPWCISLSVHVCWPCAFPICVCEICVNAHMQTDRRAAARCACVEMSQFHGLAETSTPTSPIRPPPCTQRLRPCKWLNFYMWYKHKCDLHSSRSWLICEWSCMGDSFNEGGGGGVGRQGKWQRIIKRPTFVHFLFMTMLDKKKKKTEMVKMLLERNIVYGGSKMSHFILRLNTGQIFANICQ